MNTDNGKLEKDQKALANLLVRPFDPEGGPLIMVRQLTKPGKVWCTHGGRLLGLFLPNASQTESFRQ